MPAYFKARLYVAHHCDDEAAFALQRSAFALNALSTNASVFASLQGSSNKDTRIVSYLSACICSSRRPSAVYNTILTRLRSEPMTSPQRHSPSPSPHHHQQQQQWDQDRLAPIPSSPAQRSASSPAACTCCTAASCVHQPCRQADQAKSEWADSSRGSERGYTGSPSACDKGCSGARS